MNSTITAPPATAAAAQTQPTCAIYLRISLDRTGQELGVDRQREDCEAIAKAKGWRVVKAYVDNDLSASKRSVVRPEYDAMLKAHGEGAFQHVIIWAIDRLTRQPRQLEDWIEKAEQRDMFLVTKNGDLDLSTTPGVMMARWLMAAAAAEVRQKGERQQRALLQRAQRGLAPSGFRLTGYTSKGETVEDEAATVRTIFKQFTAGNSLLGIATLLNERGVPTQRGTRWQSSTLRTILMNPRYCGRVVYGETPISGRHARSSVLEGFAGGWEPLVSEDVFDTVQSILTDPRRLSGRGGLGTHRRHLGSGLFRCYECQEPVRSHSGDAYRCWHAHLTRGSKNIDRVVLAVVAAYLTREDLAADVRRLQNGSGAAQALAEIEHQQARLVKAQKEWDDDIVSGEDFRRKKAKIEALLARATAAHAKSSNDGPLDFVLDDPTSFLGMPLNRQRRVIDMLFTVTLLRAPKGKPFDASTIDIDRKPLEG